ncbi:MAG: superoxide dismutase [Candidatus Bathyarchaeia archaeon]
MKEYTLPDLPYEYDALEPHIDKQTVTLHHDKHQQGYVNGLNSTLKKLAEAREKGDYSAIKALKRDLAFHGSGAMLHALYWEGLCTSSKSKEPTSGAFFDQVKKDFSSLEAMKAEMSAAAKAVEGSGWAVLAWEPVGKQLMIFQAENHQKLTIWGVEPLFVIDVWEHAYYLKYQNRRADYVDNIWNILNWAKVAEKFAKAK